MVVLDLRKLWEYQGATKLFYKMRKSGCATAKDLPTELKELYEALRQSFKKNTGKDINIVRIEKTELSMSGLYLATNTEVYAGEDTAKMAWDRYVEQTKTEMRGKNND